MDFTGERYIPCGETKYQDIEREHWQRYYWANDFFMQGQCVLDIASGEGYGSNLLAQKVGSVVGIDICKEAVEYAQKTYQRSNLKFLEGSVDNIPLADDSMDGIVSFETIEHVDENIQMNFLKEIKRILKQNGCLMISCPNKKIASEMAFELWEYRNPYHKKEYEIEEFKALLKNFFKCVTLFYQRTEVSLILSNEKTSDMKVLWGDKKSNEDTQNIIALCSDEEITRTPNSLLIMDINNLYLKNQHTISDLIKANNENIIVLQQEKQKIEESKRLIEQQNQALKESKLCNEQQKQELEGNMLLIEQQKQELEGNILLIERQKRELEESKFCTEQQRREIDEGKRLTEKQRRRIEASDVLNKQLRKKIEEDEAFIQQQKYAMERDCLLIEQQQLERQHLLNEILIIKSSISWKITSAIRRFLNVLKKLIKYN